MMNEAVSFNESLIAALEKLAAKKLTNRKDLAAWKLAAEKLERGLTPEQADSVPHFVWHYLGDADIRLRNASYRKDQERRLERVIRELGPRSHRPGGR
jgi:hypothetical protein